MLAPPVGLIVRRGLDGSRIDQAYAVLGGRMGLSEAGPAQVRVRLLGAVGAWRGGAELPLGPPQRRALLALLALAADQPVSRDELVDGLWPDSPPAHAVNVIQTHVKHLRQALEPGRASRAASATLPSIGQGYALRVAPTAVDALRFRGMVRQARDARRSRDHARVWQVTRDAIDMWRAPVPDVPMLAQHPRVVALHAEWQLVVTWYAEAALAQGRADEVLPLLEEQTRSRPLDEQIQVCLLRAYGALGRRADAFYFYDRARRRLAAELGVNAGQALVTAYEDLLRDDDGPASGDAVPTVAAVDVARAPSTRGPPVPAELPGDPATFTGRTAELTWLGLLTHNEVHHPAAPVVALVGTAGVGKTALAVHWARAIARRFPDGQLYVDLRGYASGPERTAPQALAHLLHSLGVEPERTPAELDTASALYRSLLDRRRMLILLDNAVDPGHVRPLLPGSARCVTLVTSRDRLTGLVASRGAHRLTVDVFTRTDAVELLSRLLGAARVAVEAEAAAELAEVCAFLPLALRIAATNLAVRPTLSIAAYIRELRERGALHGLVAGADLSVRAAFDASYRRLPPDARRLFRMLGRWPSPDVGVADAAAAVGATRGEAGRLLDRLADAHLVTEVAPGRFVLHDLLRQYAAERAE